MSSLWKKYFEFAKKSGNFYLNLELFEKKLQDALQERILWKLSYKWRKVDKNTKQYKYSKNSRNNIQLITFCMFSDIILLQMYD